MEFKELIDLVIQERASAYLKDNITRGREDAKRSDEFLRLIKDTVADSRESESLQAAFYTYLDCIACSSGDEQEGLYLFGVADGLYLARQIEQMVHNVK